MHTCVRSLLCHPPSPEKYPNQGSELPSFNAAEIARDIRVNLKLREKQRLTGASPQSFPALFLKCFFSCSLSTFPPEQSPNTNRIPFNFRLPWLKRFCQSPSIVLPPKFLPPRNRLCSAEKRHPPPSPPFPAPCPNKDSTRLYPDPSLTLALTPRRPTPKSCSSTS
jgi:hypothetical protein